VFLFPLHFQIVNQDNPSIAGEHLLPLVLSAAFGSGLGGSMSSKRNNTFYTYVIASSLVLLGTGLLSTIGTSGEIQPKTYGFQIVLGFGIGMAFASMSIVASLQADHNNHCELTVGSYNHSKLTS
jgi:hypothetical protein